MEIKEKLEKLLKTGKLYRDQGLYKEAQTTYLSALEILASAPGFSGREALLSDIQQKLDKVSAVAKHVEGAPATHELSGDVQNLIKNLFSFSEQKHPDRKALAEAVTLAKFGQTARAVAELEKLIDRPTVGLMSAKNIIRCHMLASNFDKAVEAFESWRAEKKFSNKGLEALRSLLEHHLIKKGIQKPLPKMSLVGKKGAVPGDSEGTRPPEMIDIGSVLVNFDQGPLKYKPIEFDVNFQTGNTVSLLIESKEKELLDALSIGFKLRDVEFRSSVAIFRGAGVVSAKVMIHEGPKRGDYHMDVRVQDA